MTKKINIVAIVVSTIALIVLSAVLYGLTFEVWSASRGLDPVVVEANQGGGSFIAGILEALLFSLGLSLLMMFTGVSGVKKALQYASIITLMIVPGIIAGSIYTGVGAAAYLIDSLYAILRSIVAALIIGGIKPKAA